jgi:hypothetical protein
MDERSRLQRLPLLLMGHLRGCQFPQLVIDQRQELLGGRGIGGRGIGGIDLRENLRHIGHGPTVHGRAGTGKGRLGVVAIRRNDNHAQSSFKIVPVPRLFFNCELLLLANKSW